MDEWMGTLKIQGAIHTYTHIHTSDDDDDVDDDGVMCQIINRKERLSVVHC